MNELYTLLAEYLNTTVGFVMNNYDGLITKTVLFMLVDAIWSGIFCSLLITTLIYGVRIFVTFFLDDLYDYRRDRAEPEETITKFLTLKKILFTLFIIFAIVMIPEILKALFFPELYIIQTLT